MAKSGSFLSACASTYLIQVKGVFVKKFFLVLAVAVSGQVLAQEFLPFPPTPSASTAGPTVEESVHQKRVVPSRLPDDAPNILIVLIDDVGPGQADTFGGYVHTPALSRVASEGISFNRFHSTAMCSPTRAALLTGRNHHRVGNGQITEYANDWDGYSGVIPKSSATIAEVLRNYGYATSAFGKWHNTPTSETSPAGPFDNWPTGYGFENFYGFLAGEASQYEPKLVRGTTMVDQKEIHREGYHLSEDLADQAIGWLQRHKALQPEKPFFMYWASGAAHGPHHVAKEWADKYKGEFDEGWDVLRERVLGDAKAKNWIPEDTKLTPRPASMPAWDSIPEEERAFQLRLMEVYAGFIEHVDAQVGRVLDEVDRLDYTDNTIVFYIWGDNGASAEGQFGSISELLAQNGIVAPAKEQVAALESLGGLEALGGPKVENMAHAGWAWAGGSPYKSTKLVAAHFGGSRQPLAVRWPKGIKPDTTPRAQFHHVNDITPTIYEILGITPPKVVNGIEQDPFDGISMQYAFAMPDAEGRKKTQYFEIYASRGIYHEGWFAGTFGPRVPWVPGVPSLEGWSPANDQWELYNLDDDWSQADDLASDLPDKLAEMKKLFLKEAERNKAFPIGGAFWSTAAMHPEDAPVKPTTEWYYPGPITQVPEFVGPRLGNTSNVVTIDVEVAEDANGTLYAIGGFAGGMTVFVKDGFVNYEHNLFLLERTKFAARKKLPAGRSKIEIASTRAEAGNLYSPIGVVIKVNGEEVATGRVPKSAPSLFSFNDGFDVGSDMGSPVSSDYFHEAPFKFEGKLHSLKARYVR